MSEETKVIEKKCGHNCLLCGHEWLGSCTVSNVGYVTKDTPICDMYWFAGSEERLKEIESDIKEFNLNDTIHVLSLNKTHTLQYKVKDLIYDIILYPNCFSDGDIIISYSIMERGNIKAMGKIEQSKKCVTPVEIHCEWLRLKLSPAPSRDHSKLLSLKVSCVDVYTKPE